MSEPIVFISHITIKQGMLRGSKWRPARCVAHRAEQAGSRKLLPCRVPLVALGSAPVEHLGTDVANQRTPYGSPVPHRRQDRFEVDGLSSCRTVAARTCSVRKS